MASGSLVQVQDLERRNGISHRRFCCEDLCITMGERTERTMRPERGFRVCVHVYVFNLREISLLILEEIHILIRGRTRRDAVRVGLFLAHIISLIVLDQQAPKIPPHVPPINPGTSMGNWAL